MNIKITGANGYIGKKLVELLRSEGKHVKIIDRRLLYASQKELADQILGSDVIINLAGAPILQRWTKHNKIAIYNSRVVTTKKLCDAINSIAEDHQPKVFISASAIGIYQAKIVHEEDSRSLSSGFSGKLVMDWENASLNLDKPIRRVIFRLGIVLGKDSNTIKNMLPVFKLGLGGIIGDGAQAFPFIHIDDVLRIFHDAVNNDKLTGIFNLVAPQQIDNRKLTNSLAGLLNRPAFMKVPGFAIKAFLGEASELLLKSPFVVPKRLTQSGFHFNYPTIEETLDEIIT